MELGDELMGDVPVQEILVPPGTVTITVKSAFGGGYSLTFTGADLMNTRAMLAIPAGFTVHPEGRISFPTPLGWDGD